MLPGVVAERCVHTLIETASCQACVDVCPLDAWVLDDEQLGIDAERCDGCRLCVAACPQGAIQAHSQPAFISENGRTVAMLACEPAGTGAGNGVIPCLHAISLNALMLLYRQGVKDLLSCSADCDDCVRGATARIELRLDNVNQLLRERGLPPMHHQRIATEAWMRLAKESDMTSTGPAMSRRQFFRRATRAAMAEKGQLSELGIPSIDTFEPAGSIIPSENKAHSVPFLPQIDPNRCNACNACARLCPHAAIRIDETEPPHARAYRITPDQCSGCGICTDVCDQQAVSVSSWASPKLLRIPLNADRCRDCGATYHYPAGQRKKDHQCRICAVKNNHQLLYQTLD